MAVASTCAWPARKVLLSVSGRRRNAAEQLRDLLASLHRTLSAMAPAQRLRSLERFSPWQRLRLEA